MKFNELTIKSHKPRRRAGRGISAGLGKTAGRGTKGQKARTGNGRRPGFEGGQNPLMKRLPKLRGFTSKRTPKEVIYTGQLAAIGATIDNFALYNAGLVSSPYASVKLISKGEITKKHSVSLQAASANAIALLQAKDGTFKAIDRLKQSPKTTDKKD